MCSQVRAKVVGASAPGFGAGAVSSKRQTMSASEATPKAARVSSAARQLKRSDSRPPSGGLRQAMTASPDMPLDITRAPSTGE